MKKRLKFRYFSSDAEGITVVVTCLDGQISDFFSGLQKLEFGRFLVGLRTYHHPRIIRSFCERAQGEQVISVRCNEH